MEVRRCGGMRDAEQHALVLAAAGIASRLVMEGRAVALLVAAADAPRARFELAEYARENRGRGRPPPPVRRLAGGIDGALVYCAVLLFLDAASRRDVLARDWFEAGAAAAGLIVAGEWWRTVTALTLHADFGHLVGNIAFGALFGLLLAQFLGAGLLWLAVLLSGAVGNALNAVFQSAGHTAVGASTAVFAALGMLAALMWRRQAGQRPQGLRRWAPLAAGVMLLAYIGVGGERTDIGAHFAGFATGAAAGFGLARAGHRLPHGPRAEAGYAAAAFAVLTLAWGLALLSGG